MGSLSPCTEPRAQGQREETHQARQQARLWCKFSFMQFEGKDKLTKKKNKMVLKTHRRASQQPREAQSRSGQLSTSQSRTRWLGWPPGSNARGVGRQGRRRLFRLTHLLPPQLLFLSHSACSTPTFSWFGFKP